MIPFFNAQLEGIDKSARAFRENPSSFAIKAAASVTLPSVLLWMANKDDARYRELPQWQKDLFWIVPTDKWVDMDAKAAAGVGDAHKRQGPEASGSATTARSSGSPSRSRSASCSARCRSACWMRSSLRIRTLSRICTRLSAMR